MTSFECNCIRIFSETFYSEYGAQGDMMWKEEINFIKMFIFCRSWKVCFGENKCSPLF